MKRTTLALCLFIVLLAPLMPLMQSNSVLANAETSIPKPSVPEFTVKLIDSSYDVPTTYSTNPYTGEKITHPAYRVESRTIEIRIKNVPFSPFEIKNGSNTYTVQYYYNIRFKGHFEEEWRIAYNPNVNSYRGRDSGAETVISLKGEYLPTEGLKLTPDSAGFYATFPPNAQVDFQVEAMIGYIHHVDAMPFSADVFEGETSGWSETQTLTIPASSSPSPTPDQEPQQTDVVMIILALALIVIIVSAGLGLLVHLVRKK